MDANMTVGSVIGITTPYEGLGYWEAAADGSVFSLLRSAIRHQDTRRASASLLRPPQGGGGSTEHKLAISGQEPGAGLFRLLHAVTVR